MPDILHLATRFKSSVKKPLYLFAGAAIGLTLLVGCVDPVEHRVFHPTTPPGVPLPPNSVRDRTLSTAAEDLALPQSELGTLESLKKLGQTDAWASAKRMKSACNHSSKAGK